MPCMLQSSKGSGSSVCQDSVYCPCVSIISKLFYLPLDSGLVVPDSSVGGPNVYVVRDEKNRSVHLPSSKLLTDSESLKILKSGSGQMPRTQHSLCLHKQVSSLTEK